MPKQELGILAPQQVTDAVAARLTYAVGYE